ncbi:SpoVR family protein [Shigella boydii]|nr:SpoVR family protein [Shigella boydii]
MPTPASACQLTIRTGSFGKKFIETERLYKHGQQGLAYEIVINSNPCIAYLMEENTITMASAGDGTRLLWA